jgi:ketosteroid isomerase-like protein
MRSSHASEEEKAVAGRTPQEVFQHHAEVLIGGDLEGIVSDYSDDAVFITPAGVKRGKDGVREGFTQLLKDVPDAEWSVPTQFFEGDVLFIEWNATSAASRAMDGIDTFVFSADGIRVQTVRYTLERS